MASVFVGEVFSLMSMGEETDWIRDFKWIPDGDVFDTKVHIAWLSRAYRPIEVLVAPGWGQAHSAERSVLTCNVCQMGVVALVKHPICGHTACARCWAAELPALPAFGDGLLRMDSPCRRCVKGCQICNANAGPLVVTSASCGHAACGPCWRQWLEIEASRCLREARFRLACLCPGCEQTFGIDDDDDGRRLCSLSPMAERLDAEIRSARQRAQTVTARLHDSPGPGLVCGICREHRFVLLPNAACGGSACEACLACWVAWGESQLLDCRAGRRDVCRCLGPGCMREVEATLWQHLARTSDIIGEFFSSPEVSGRRRLRQNPFYPAEMQVDCPEAGCWGLGYLGFDMLMCFMCEHQWLPEEPGSAPEDVSEQDFVGLKIKPCPRCGEAIEKSGGCDHMTCRCRHQFWWTTLKPFTR
uniref:RING-type domain-containing protein n=1 Tax=Zooxanthella nutricula TaxID=1333877 RepID=A0A7S2JLR0_9DINO